MTEPKKITEAELELIREEKRQYAQKYYQKNKKALAEKQKEWRRNNPDKVKAANQRHWLKKVQKKQG